MKAMVVSTLLAAGCGSASDVTGSCDTRSLNGACQEYVGAADVVAAYQSACTQGTWRAGTCSRSGSVGGCQSVSTSPVMTTVNWFFPPQTATSVRQLCVAPATYVSP